MLVRVVRVVADEVGQTDQVRHVAVGPEAQPVGGVHHAVEPRVAFQRAVGPVQRLFETTQVGQRGGDVGVDREVVRVVHDGAAQRGERLRDPAGTAVRVPQPDLSQLGRTGPGAADRPVDREPALAEAPGQR